MSNYAALRSLVIATHAPAYTLRSEAQSLFDKAWELAKGDESKVADIFVGLLHPHPPEPAPQQSPPIAPPVPPAIPPKPQVMLDVAALSVIVDALGSRTGYDDASRAQVLKELLVQLRRVDLPVGVTE